MLIKYCLLKAFAKSGHSCESYPQPDRGARIQKRECPLYFLGIIQTYVGNIINSFFEFYQ